MSHHNHRLLLQPTQHGRETQRGTHASTHLFCGVNHRRVRRAKPLWRLQLKQTRTNHTEHRERQRRAKKVAVVKRYSTRLRHDSPAGKILRIDRPAGI